MKKILICFALLCLLLMGCTAKLDFEEMRTYCKDFFGKEAIVGSFNSEEFNCWNQKTGEQCTYGRSVLEERSCK